MVVQVAPAEELPPLRFPMRGKSEETKDEKGPEVFSLLPLTHVHILESFCPVVLKRDTGQPGRQHKGLFPLFTELRASRRRDVGAGGGEESTTEVCARRRRARRHSYVSHVRQDQR